ncbi:phosphatase PAP2 family protein [Marinobacterium sp. LSUCC0821]|uniref:phosphatase PAP2 family protein n=1 Tax=Marinobacterium sp. LSUCC0821 TaxID=2668067 RepID=UPI001452723F|nr:phosphatase PAP2 family protein [Marinobacterium sp. LSUCC0821]QJD71088.1 phosphatase PAP2 family protein [Marinobacterium sp. LSUCC0821]
MNSLLRPKPTIFIATAVAIFLLNQSLFSTVNAIGAYLPESLWVLITNLGDTSVALAIILALYAYKQDSGVRLLIVAIIGTLVIQGLKHLFGVDRPPVALDLNSFHLIGSTVKSPSFPSGHTATAFIGAGILAAQYPLTWVKRVVLICAGLIGLSRIMMGVHWPFDVLIGAILGWVIGYYGYQKLMTVQFNKRLSTWISGAVVLIILINAITYHLPYSEFWPTVYVHYAAVALALIGAFRAVKVLTKG